MRFGLAVLVSLSLCHLALAQSKPEFIWQKDMSVGRKADLQYAGSKNYLVWSNSEGFILADNQTGEIKHALKTPGATGRVWVSDDEETARFGSTNGYTEVNLVSKKVSVHRDLPGPAVFSSDGKKIAIASPDLKVTVIDTDRKVLAQFENAKKPIFSQDAKRIIAFDVKKSQEFVADLADGTVLFQKETASPSLVWLDGSRTLASFENEIYELTDEAFEKAYENPEKGARVAYGRPGFVVYSIPFGTQILNTKDWKVFQSLPLIVTSSVCLSESGEEIIFGEDFVTGYTVRSKAPKNIYALSGQQTLCRLSPDNAYALTQSAQPFSYTAITDLRSRKTLGFVPSSPSSASFVGDSSFAVFGKDGLEIRSLPNFEVKARAQMPFGYLAAPKDGSVLACASPGKGLFLIDPQSGKILQRQNLGMATSVTFNQGGNQLAVIDGTTVRILEARNLQDVIKVKVTTPPTYNSNFFFEARDKFLNTVISSPISDAGQLALIQISTGINLGPSLPAAPYHASADGRFVAVFPINRGILLFDTSSYSQTAWVGEELGRVQDCVPFGLSTNLFVATSNRIGVLALPRLEKKGS